VPATEGTIGMNLKEAEKHLILKCYAGSQTYGTNTKSSDTDTKGIYIPPRKYWIGLQKAKTLEEHTPKIDTSYHDIKHFFELALNLRTEVCPCLPYSYGRHEQGFTRFGGVL